MCHPIDPTQSGDHKGWAEAKDLQMFRVPTPSPFNLGGEARPVRAALSSALEEALPGTPPARPQAGLVFCPVPPHYQPSFSLAAK